MDKRDIAKLFQTHGVDLSDADVWEVQKTPVIKHSALERLSAALKITWEMPTIVRSERDECVVLVRATRQDGISEWSFGEAMIVLMKDTGRKNKWDKPIYEAPDGVSGNYQVTPKQASYVYAMAEKRAKDRVIIKLAGLYGAYSEEEADDFKQGKQDAAPSNVTRMEPPSPKPDELGPLVTMGDEAASRGSELLKTWWTSRSATERKLLGPDRIAAWKTAAAAVDAAEASDPALRGAA